jgi:predicted GNAT family N-acyltransferase
MNKLNIREVKISDLERCHKAGVLMNAFIDIMKRMNKKDIYLLCKEELISMYTKYGFLNQGKSGSSHGGSSWYEMLLVLNK